MERQTFTQEVFNKKSEIERHSHFVSQRTEEEIEFGISHVTGEISKNRKIVNGISISTVSINLRNIIYRDVEELIRLITIEAFRIKQDNSGLSGKSEEKDSPPVNLSGEQIHTILTRELNNP